MNEHQMRLVIEAINRAEQGLRQVSEANRAATRAIERDWERANQANTRGFNRFVSRITTGVRNLVRGFGTLRGAMLGIGAAAVGRAFIGNAMRLEQMTAGLTAVVGSAEEAASALGRLRVIAQRPGINLEQAIDAAVNLRSVELNANLAERAIAAVGDQLAVVGRSNELDGVIRGITQMVGNGRILQEEVNQITERLPLFRMAMERAFGASRAEDIQALGISVEQFLEGTISKLEEMETVGENATTAMSNFENAWFDFSSAAGTVFLPALTSLLNGLTALLKPMADFIKRSKDIEDQGGGGGGFVQGITNIRNNAIAAVRRALGRDVAVGTGAVSLTPSFQGAGVGGTAAQNAFLQQVQFAGTGGGGNAFTEAVAAAAGVETAQSRQDALRDLQRTGFVRFGNPLARQNFLNQFGLQRTQAPLARRLGDPGFTPVAVTIPGAGLPGGGIARTSFPSNRVFEGEQLPRTAADDVIGSGIFGFIGAQRQRAVRAHDVRLRTRLPGRGGGADPLGEFAATFRARQEADERAAQIAVQTSATIVNAWNQIAVATDNMALRVIGTFLQIGQTILEVLQSTGGLGGAGGFLSALASANPYVIAGTAAVIGSTALLSRGNDRDDHERLRNVTQIQFAN